LSLSLEGLNEPFFLSSAYFIIFDIASSVSGLSNFKGTARCFYTSRIYPIP
jgi:hypothetical protein